MPQRAYLPSDDGAARYPRDDTIVDDDADIRFRRIVGRLRPRSHCRLMMA